MLIVRSWFTVTTGSAQVLLGLVFALLLSVLVPSLTHLKPCVYTRMQTRGT